jgi:hypothetical protein
MKPDEHVYCTDCVNFILDDDNTPYCEYENKCNIQYPEDSVPYKDRSYFEQKEL